MLILDARIYSPFEGGRGMLLKYVYELIKLRFI